MIEPEEKQKITFFVDDSGVMHSNDKIFVYGGLYFFTEEEKNEVSRQIIALKKKEGITQELKYYSASENALKQALKILRKYRTMTVICRVYQLREETIATKEDRGRYKDYIAKLIIKKVIKTEIALGNIDPTRPLDIVYMMDQQATVTNGRYELKESVIKELTKGMQTETGFHQPIFFSDLTFKYKQCVSNRHAVIQAADVIAGYHRDRANKGIFAVDSKLSKHVHLTLPQTVI